MICPAATCRAENVPGTESCRRCGAPLAAYERLSAHAAQLYNAGLDAAAAGDLRRARDLLSAVVHWHPLDIEARNAFALACLKLGDAAEARRNWNLVLASAPEEPFARRGLRAVARRQRSRRRKR